MPQSWWLLLAVGAVLVIALVVRSRRRVRGADRRAGSSEAAPPSAAVEAREPDEAEGADSPDGDGPGEDASPARRARALGAAEAGPTRGVSAGREVARRAPAGPGGAPDAGETRAARGAPGEAGRAGSRPGAAGSGGAGGAGPGGAATGRSAGSGGPESGGPQTAGPEAGRVGSAPVPSGRTALFAYGGPTPGGLRLPGPYAVVAIRTNGFTPMRDHIVELAVVGVDARGRVEGEPFVTLLEPPGGRSGATFLHGLESAGLRFAPGFADAARLFLARIEGRIVVTHQARLVEQFLAAEFLAAGMLVPTSPALDISSLTRLTFATPNYRLRTLAAHLELRAPRGGAALDEARLVAAILPRLLARLGRDLTYPVPLTTVHDIPRGAARPAPRPRPVVPDTLEPWLDALMTRLAAGATETNDPRVAAYLEALTDVVSRGRTATDESAELAAMLARSGYPAGQIRTILERFLESLRQAAFEESRISPAHLRHLRAVAVSVGIPTYFDDLIPPPAPVAPPPGSGTFSRPVRKPPPVKAPPRLPRCGHCLGVGHWTANCPRLRGSGGRGAVGPVRPVDPI